MTTIKLATGNEETLPFATLDSYKDWYEQHGGIIGWAELADVGTSNRYVDEVLSCECVNKEVRHDIYRNGTVHYFLQCVKCGKYQSIKKPQPEPETTPLLDKNLAEFWQQQRFNLSSELRRLAQEHKRATEKADWLEGYSEYLASTEWCNKRERVLRRDNGTCQACLKRNATQVHHLTYERVFNEPLFDLVSVCDICHEAIHGGRQ